MNNALNIQVAAVAKRKKVSHVARLIDSVKKHWEVYLMLVPPTVLLVLFAYWPMLGIIISFEDFSVRFGMFASRWIGFKEYLDFLTSPNFPQLLSNTILLSIYNLVASFPIPIILAICINEIRSTFLKKTVQSVTYAPYFISTVVLVGILMQFLDLHNGFINHVIVLLGGHAVNFMGTESFFRSIYVWSGVWQTTGYSAIIYIAALTSVDPSLVEASTIDGATRLQKIMHVDLPAIAPTIVILLIMAMGNMFSIGFEKVYVMQNNMNLDVSEIISTFVYKRGLQNIDYAYATAVGVFNSIANLILLIVANWGAKRFGETSLF